MKARKILFGVLALSLIFGVSGCGSKKEDKKVDKESNEVIDDYEEDDETSNEVSNTNPNKKYIKMEVKNKQDGSTSTYDVDCYAIGDIGSQYYFVKDDELYNVKTAKPDESFKVATGVKYVIWDNKLGFIAIADITANIINPDAVHLTYVYSNFDRAVVVTSMDDGSTKDYIVNNSARGVGGAGLSNHYYYVKGDELYYINASNIEKSTKIATGVKYVGFSDSDGINGFAAFITKDFKYVDESSAYLLKTFKLYY